MENNSSSPLVSREAIILWGIISLIALYLGQTVVAVVFFSFMSISLLSRFWGEKSADRVNLSLNCSLTCLFPGQSTTLSWEISNDKWLPLPWLELVQNAPPKDCLIPPADLEHYHEPGMSPDSPDSLRQTFPFLGGHQKVTRSQEWTAARRGLYTIDHLRACTGDGFGLIQRDCPLPEAQIPTIAVYPVFREVDLAPFLRSRWDTISGSSGWIEDPTILRGNREYQNGDSWKRINWRLAARDQGLPVNLYQTIRPYLHHFILDGESFLETPELLEEALEILSSLLISLDRQGTEISLSISRSLRYPALTLHAAEGGNLSQMLFYLAGYDCCGTKIVSEDGRPSSYLPSVFPEDVIPLHGSVWLITRSGKKIPEDLLDRLRPSRTCILCPEDPEVSTAAGWTAYPIHTLRR